MKVRFEPAPTYFVHIPKTGGVSLGTLLETAFKSVDFVRLKPPTLAKLTLSDLKGFRCYHAMHQGRSLLELTGRSDLTVMTMLRDPIERSISNVLYLQRTVSKNPETFTQAYLAQVEPILHADLSECLDHTAFVNACDSQIRTLGILEDYRPLFKGSPDAASGRSVVRPYDLPPFMDTSDKALLLDNAQRWLGEMAVVGLTEHYAESTLLVCDAIGIPAPANLPRLNVNPQRTEPSESYRSRLAPKIVSQLEELTAHDRQLYTYANELFLQQWARHQAHPSRTYSLAPRLRPVVRSARRSLRLVTQFLRRFSQGHAHENSSLS